MTSRRSAVLPRLPAINPARPTSPPLAVRAVELVLVLGVVAFAASVVLADRQQSSAAWVFDDLVQPAVSLVAGLLILARAWRRTEERLAWLLLGIGFTAGLGIGDVAYSAQESLGLPSLVPDVFYLGAYVLLFAGCAALVRDRLGGFSRTLVLDGVITSLGVAAVAAAVLLPVAFDAAGGDLDVNEAVTLVYPFVDTILIAIVVGSGWALARQLDRSVLALGVSLSVLCLSDVVYAVQSLHGTYVEGTALELGFLLSSTLAAVAAWQPPERVRARGERRGAPVLPLVAAAMSVVVLAVSVTGKSARGMGVARLLAVTVLALTIIRLAMAFHEVRSLLRAREEARTDDLTGLRNRRALVERLRRSEYRLGNPLALLVLDLDGFKDVNDTMGHHAGDTILQEVGRRLALLAAAFNVELYRLGGDEFALVVADPTTEQCDAIARMIVATVAEPFVVDGRTVVLGVSVGIAELRDVLSTDLVTSGGDALLRAADRAMYIAKRDKGGVARYRSDLPDSGDDLLALATELRLADLDRDVELHLQPKMSATTGAIVGVEALVRFRDASGTVLPAWLFVSMADRVGRMTELTRSVLVQALDWCRHWFINGRALGIAVNVTAADLADEGFADFVQGAVAACHLPPELLTVEVTENTILADMERSRATLARLRAMGVRVSLDDFGVGYSSLSHLRDLPIDEIKLDQSFTRDASTDDRALAIVGATIELGHRLGASVVAEGIEDAASADLMISLGVDQLQGFYHFEPMRVADLLPGGSGAAARLLTPARRRAGGRSDPASVDLR